MGKKIFISYKYGDGNVYPLPSLSYTTVRTYVDKLEDYFDRTNNIYKGESDDEDLSRYTDEQIWEKLKDRIFDSSVTIIMISPNMKQDTVRERSQWIPWEVSYSLKEMMRNDRKSYSNAVIAVVLPDRNNSYDYFIKDNQCNSCSCRTLYTDKLFKIISSNMFNQKNKTKKDCCTNPASNVYTGEVSYILSVKWVDFVNNPNFYIDNAIKLKDNIENYEIFKDV